MRKLILVALLFTGGLSNAFFGAQTCPSGLPQGAIRQVCRPLNEPLFLDTQGEPKSLVDTQFSVALFPTLGYEYTATVTDSYWDQGNYTWVGVLDVQYSYFYVIYMTSSGLFILHFAEPQGVFEATRENSQLYKIVQVQ